MEPCIIGIPPRPSAQREETAPVTYNDIGKTSFLDKDADQYMKLGDRVFVSRAISCPFLFQILIG